MSIYLYEEALINQLRKVIKDSRVNIVSPDQSINYLAEVNKDKVVFPAVLLSRGDVQIVEDLKSMPLMIRGETATVKDNLVQKVRLITVRVEWSLNIYAVDRYTCDEIMRELIFYFITNPRFYVQIPYGLDIRQEFDVLVDNSIEDNTDLNDFQNKGELFRNTINLWSDNVHLYSRGSQYIVNTVIDISNDNLK